MFKAAGAQGDLNGFLDAGSHMQGELHFEDTFRIDGKFSGNIASKGDLIIGEGGDVDAELKVRRVFISGKLRGAVHAAEGVEIAAHGKVTADLHTPSLSVEDGAFFEGRCSMDRGQGSAKGSPERPKVAQMPIANE